MPELVFPKKSDYYKVIQLLVDGLPQIAVGDCFTEHSDIVKDFLKERGISFNLEWRMGKDRPTIEGEHYKIVGAGQLDLSVERKIARFFGDSLGYMLVIDEKHVDEIKKLYPDWNITQSRF